jgi:hypothetical protein
MWVCNIQIIKQRLVLSSYRVRARVKARVRVMARVKVRVMDTMWVCNIQTIKQRLELGLELGLG